MKRVSAMLVIAIMLLGASAAAADTLDVHLVSETSSTLTLGWTPVTSGYGYLFSADGNIVSRTYAPSRSTVQFSKSYSTYEVAAIVKGATGSYPPAEPPPPPPPPPPPSNDLIVDGSWTCNKAVNYDLVRVTNHGSGDAARLASGCTGRIGRLEVSGVINGDAVKIQNADANAAHDLAIESGYASCARSSTDGTHQDGVQGMGGRNIVFSHFVFDCYGGGGGNFFIQRAGSGATTPTNIVGDHCALGPREPNQVNLGTSVGAGVRNTFVCQPLSGRNWFMTDSSAQQVVNENNTVVSSSDPRCATLQSLIAVASG